jgi:nicotinate-nucleotide adenylyltransferase
MRKLCFGGSFNPIHYGHLQCAEAAAQALGMERVILFPNSLSPHKTPTARFADSADRLEMCRLAARSAGGGFEVDDLELRRAAPSYTIDTVRQLKRDRGWPQVHWLIGADMLLDLPNWREPAALLREVEFVVLRRPGFAIDWNALPAEYSRLKPNLVTAPLLDISGTDIRRRVAQGLPIGHLVPPTVESYIRDKGLYAA